MFRIRKSRTSTRRRYKEDHRFERWYPDNCVYFITARCRNRVNAFEDERVKLVFWKQFQR